MTTPRSPAVRSRQGAAPEGSLAEDRRLRALVRRSRDLILVVDPGGLITYNSPSFATVLGYAPGSLLGTDALALIHPDDRTRIRSVLAATVTSARPSERMRHRVLDGAGEVRWIESTAMSLLDEPAVGGVVVNARDITDIKAAEDRATAGEERFQALVQNSTDAISVIGSDGSVTYMSPAAEALAGAPPGSPPVNGLDEVYDEDRPRVMEALARLLERPGESTTMRFRVPHADGTLHDLETTARNALHDPAVRGIIANTRDVTTQARAESLLVAQGRILTLIATGTPLATTLREIVSEVESRLPGARCAVQVLGPDRSAMQIAAAVSPESLACRLMEGREIDPERSICGASLARRQEMLVNLPGSGPQWGTSACMSGHPPGACWVQPIASGDGGAPIGVISCYFTGPYEPDGEARHVVGLARDLAAIAIEKQRSEDRLGYQAMHDALTGLPNKALLLDRLGNDAARRGQAEKFGNILFIDLDRFELINNSLGHASGDLLLQEVAQRITHTVRSEDTVARLGGDEFVVSIPDMPDEREVVALADRILDAIRVPFSLGAQEVTVTASIGICSRELSATTAGELLRDAGAAVKRAKEQGRNRWDIFDVPLRRRAITRLRSEAALREAVEKGQFELVYQPVWSVSRTEVRSVEALVRWPHAGGRMGMPSAFIPLAEETGLISSLGSWVLDRACADGAWLDRKDCHIPHLAVNASARQLTDGSLVPAVENALNATGWDPRRLTVEVTESALILDPGAAMRTLRSLHRLHVMLALDDFGTGFSAMGYLKRFRYFDVIKIDRSFISGLQHPRSADRAIVRATVALAEALGATVIAEGVETVEQLEALIALGCDRMQGYLIAKPMRLDALRTALMSTVPFFVRSAA